MIEIYVQPQIKKLHFSETRENEKKKNNKKIKQEIGWKRRHKMVFGVLFLLQWLD